jgi:hypothetical protein
MILIGDPGVICWVKDALTQQGIPKYCYFGDASYKISDRF